MKLPREKIIEDGVDSLSDSELLAIMLGSGTKDYDVFTMSEQLIKDYGLSGLFRMSYKELSKLQGIKKAKASKIMAIFEISRRVMHEEQEKVSINDAKSLFEYVYPSYYGMKKEVLMVIGVDSKLKIINEKKYTSDSYSEIHVSLKDLIKDIISMDPYGVFLIHNHPGGNINPSNQDISYTMDLGTVLKNLNILLLDHLIISLDKYYSFSNKGSLNGIPYWFIFLFPL